jgi:hypothetical protein
MYLNSVQTGTLALDATTLQALSRFKTAQLGGSSLVITGPASSPSNDAAAEVQELIHQTQQLELKLKHLKKQLSEEAAKALPKKPTGEGSGSSSGSSGSPKK